ncbi:MAG: RNA-binding protein [Hyphomicrobiales bacterium]|nr:RNA-binding protein [Hyphomicrobiales bacterium]MBV8662840.1 RNA-binding protein [Hyphomicrobiales bacterium]
MRKGEDTEESGSERTCVVTGEKGPPEAMLRFALSGSAEVAPDIRRKLPGRGVWTKLDFATVRQAAAKQAFSRGFRTKATAPADLAEIVDRLLEQDALQFLSIVNKAGLVVAGATKVEAAIAAGRVVALIHAADGAVDGAAKLERLLRGRHAEAAETVTRINLFPSRQLDLALGRTNVIHAALNAGEASEAFLAKVARLIQYRASEAAPRAAIDASSSGASDKAPNESIE